MASDSSVDTPALAFLSSLFDPGKLPPAAMALNHSANAFLAGQAFWGPVTATLDWCEVSLLCSRARSALPGRRQWPCLLDPRSPSSHAARPTTSSRATLQRPPTPSPTSSPSHSPSMAQPSPSQRTCRPGTWPATRCVILLRLHGVW